MATTTLPLSLRLDVDVHSDLQKKADHLGVKKSDLARRYIVEGLQFGQDIALIHKRLEQAQEQLLILTQELQRIQKQNECTERYIHASTSVFIAYAEGTTPEDGARKWENLKKG